MGSSTKVRESFDAASVGPVRWRPISVLVHRAACSLLFLVRRAGPWWLSAWWVYLVFGVSLNGDFIVSKSMRRFCECMYSMR
jgi:hypothetical protein